MWAQRGNVKDLGFWTLAVTNRHRFRLPLPFGKDWADEGQTTCALIRIEDWRSPSPNHRIVF